MKMIEKKNCNICLIVIFILMLGFILEGCDHTALYSEPYSDLGIQASNSLLGIFDVTDTQVIVMEEDDFGRTMYFYYGDSVVAYDSLGAGGKICAFLIRQKKDNHYVYYYSDYNFIVRKKTDSGYLNNDQLLEKTREVISDEEIEKLKEKNDWNKPIDGNKCIKVKLSRWKRDYQEKLVSKNVMQEVYNKMCLYGRPKHIEQFFRYLTSDDYDRHIYFFRTADADNNYTNSYVVMFNPDGSYDIAEILDLWNYQDELKEFKEKNNWNKPI